jgi:alpha-D-xyloside xylohydrolase
MKRNIFAIIFFLVAVGAAGQSTGVDLSITSVEQSDREVVFQAGNSAIKLYVCTPSIIRVISSPEGSFSDRESLSVINQQPGDGSYALEEKQDHYLLKTAQLLAKVDKATSAVSFFDLQGELLLAESYENGRTFINKYIGGEDVYTVQQTFQSPDSEAIYGFGQYQDGIMDWRNVYVQLKQENITAVMPAWFSSRGYGVFWHNYSFTEVNPEKEELKMGATGNIMRTSFRPEESGTYTFDIQREGIHRMEFRIDDEVIYEHKTGVYAPSAVCKAELEAGRSYDLVFESFDTKINPPVAQEFLIPASNIERADAGAPVSGGLLGEYYDNSSLEGEPVLVRVDPEVMFDWGSGSFGEEYHNDNFSVRWTGKLVSDRSKKECMLSVTTDDGVRLYIDGRLVVDSWKERGPETDAYIMDVEAGREYDVKIEYYESGGGAYAKFGWDMVDPGKGENELLERVKIFYRTPGQAEQMTIQSEVADEIDYYFIYGPEADAFVDGMRELTGRVPLYPKWAHGLFMSHMAWNTQEEIKDVVRTHREKGIPLDCIVQDMNYWELHPKNLWGSHLFDAARYPDPAAMTRYFHENNAKVMISIWPRFNVTTDTYRELERHGYMLSLQKTSTTGNEGIEMESVTANAAYDPFSEGARQMYWDFIDERLMKKGFDAWWLDATEPEWGYDFSKAHTAMGSGYRYLNAYSLMSMKGVYEGQLSTDSTHRPYILTRSSFPGQQRYGVTTWSGDIGYDWDVYRKQISCGLNFSITGDPYYTHDIGGFIPGADIESEDYRELLYRWFQFGVFTPVFRVHGCRETELWATGPKMEEKLTEYTHFRYRLMPYIYSVGAMVTFDNYTIMRPLVMDFRGDSRIAAIDDQYMFGPSILVNPVTEPGAGSRSVYLPENQGGWIDFFTGESRPGGRTVEAAAGKGAIPLYIKAGAIIPMGPYLQYSTEKFADTLEIRIYRGADGEFCLYEDENDGFGYQAGEFSKIGFSWDDRKQQLLIGERQGSFSGMSEERVFNIYMVREGTGTGIHIGNDPDRTLRYKGKRAKVKMKIK